MPPQKPSSAPAEVLTRLDGTGSNHISREESSQEQCRLPIRWTGSQELEQGHLDALGEEEERQKKGHQHHAAENGTARQRTPHPESPGSQKLKPSVKAALGCQLDWDCESRSA
jgi:hypothetical protein